MWTPAGVLLAAGLGARYDPSGECLKLLQPARTGAYEGLPLVVAAARNLRSVIERVVAVVRPRDHPHQPQLHDALLKEGCELVPCKRAIEGMGASLACGIDASSHADAWIVALGDMPAINRATIDAVVAALRAGHVTAAPTYRKQRGHPVGFAASCLGELLRSAGDEGARAVLERFPPHLIEVNDNGVLIDVDHR